MRELPGRTSAQCSSRSAAQSAARLGCRLKLSAAALQQGVPNFHFQEVQPEVDSGCQHTL